METFRQLLVYAVTGQTSTFQGASFTIGSATEQPVGIVVSTTVNVPGKAPATVQWVVAMMSGQPKIIDIIAEGTSLRLTERKRLRWRYFAAWRRRSAADRRHAQPAGAVPGQPDRLSSWGPSARLLRICMANLA